MFDPVTSFDPTRRVIDLSGWVGQYPFRMAARGSLMDLSAKAQALGLQRVVACPYEAIFFEDNLEVFEDWADRAADQERVELWPVVNPPMPGQLRRLEALHARAGFRGIRLLPSYHGYKLYGKDTKNVMDFAKERNLIVQVFHRIADERWHWILKTPSVPQGDVQLFAGSYPDQTIVLSAFSLTDELTRHLATIHNVYADLAQMRGPVLALERNLDRWPLDKLVFGSLWPMQILEATLWQITETKVPKPIKEQVLWRNAERLLQAAGPGPVFHTFDQTTGASTR